MFVEVKTITVKKGFSEKVINRFSKNSKVQEMEGFIDFTIMKKLRKEDTEELVIQIRWENQECFTNWKKSDTHKQMHSNKPKEKPEHIVNMSVDMYNVELTKLPL